MINPKLSVAIFAQNGVYAFFAAAFIPIIVGMFFKDVSKFVPIAGALSAVVIHFTMYYGKISVPFTISTGENPGVSAATAIILSIVISIVFHFFTRKR